LSDVFISYAREDQATVKRFAEGFERQGFGVWWDAALRSGDSFDLKIEEAIRAAKAVIVLWSPHSAQSRWVRAEATLADRNRTLVPARIAACDLPIMFELTHTADLAHWQGAADDKAWLAFLADVQRFVEKDRAPAQAAPTPVPSTPAPAPKGVRGEAPSLAVLPFTNRSGLAEDEVFAIGMVEDVIDALSQGVNVRVIASSATARFRTGAIPDLDAMARQLGVRYILEGNVRRAGANLRVTSQLIEAASGAILWTQKFDRPLTELAALQENLVLEVAAHLDAQVYRIEMERALKKPGDLTAWEAVTRSFAALRQMSGPSISVALEEARRAVAIAPDYGLAHAMLAVSHTLLYHYFGPDDSAAVARAREHIDRALALDPDNALVLGYIAQALCLLGQPREGLHLAERAIALSPGMAFAYHARGTACILLDRFDEGLAHWDAELRASPGAHTQYLSHTWQANAHIRAGRWDEAMAAVDRALALNPDFSFALAGKAFLCRRDGRMPEARDLFRRAREAEPAATIALWELRMRRRFVRNPVAEELVQHVRALWAETEPGT
jgi:TolB-like protein/Tfp pilus assembly protein PilF